MNNTGESLKTTKRSNHLFEIADIAQESGNFLIVLLDCALSHHILEIRITLYNRFVNGRLGKDAPPIRVLTIYDTLDLSWSYGRVTDKHTNRQKLTCFGFSNA